VSQNEPFDEFLGSRIADPFFYRTRFGNFGLSHQIERVLYRREVSGQWSGVLTLRSYMVRQYQLEDRDMPHVPTFLKEGCSVMLGPAHLLGTMILLVAS
jgi:hypothetical protein